MYEKIFKIFRQAHLSISENYGGSGLGLSISNNIYSTTNKNTIGINPQMEYQPKIKKIISQVFNEINDMKPEMPDGSKKRIELILKS